MSQKISQLWFWWCLTAGFLAWEFFEMCFCWGDGCGKNNVCVWWTTDTFTFLRCSFHFDFVANNATTCSFLMSLQQFDRVRVYDIILASSSLPQKTCGFIFAKFRTKICCLTGSLVKSLENSFRLKSGYWSRVVTLAVLWKVRGPVIRVLDDRLVGCLVMVGDENHGPAFKKHTFLKSGKLNQQENRKCII